MPVAPWLQWPPIDVSGSLPPGLQNIVPIAAGHVNTEEFTDDCVAYGIAAHVISPVGGEAILKLVTPVARDNFVGVATFGLPPELGGGLFPVVEWIDSTTIRIRSYKTIGAFDPAPRIDFAFYNVNTSQVPPVPDPLSILGGNLAVWLQSDLGISADPVTTWINQMPGQGDASQGALTAAPTLVPNSFVNQLGVACHAPDQGLTIDLTAPLLANTRPWIMMLGRVLARDPTATTIQVGFWGWKGPGNPTLSPTEIEFDAEPVGTFDPSDSFWNANTSQESFITNAGSDIPLTPVLVEVATEQTNALTVTVFNNSGNQLSQTSADAAAAVPVTTDIIDTIRLSAADQAPFVGGTPGQWNYGLIIVSRDTPTPTQLAQLRAYAKAWLTA